MFRRVLLVPSWCVGVALALVTLVAPCLLLSLISGCSLATARTTLPPVPPPHGSPTGDDRTRTCINGKCLTYTTWGRNIDAAIGGQAVGYAYVILHDGIKTPAAHAFGQARTAADPPATAMTTTSTLNAASVSKTLTAVAVLHLLSAKHVSVDSSIAAYLPPSWPLGQNVAAITFAQLLTHTSGIQLPKGDHGADDDSSFAALKAIVAQDIDVSPTGYKAGCLLKYSQGMFSTCYQNANFSLFRVIIPYLLGSANPYPPATISGDAQLDEATAKDYLSYMTTVYGSSFPVSCTPQGSAPTLAYKYPATGKGSDWGDALLNCGAGGLQLSADDMATFLAHLSSGDYLPLTSSDPDTVTFPEMLTKMYGWDYRYPDTHGMCVAKNGALGAVSQTTNIFIPYITSLIVYCPQTGLAFAGIANSRLGSSPATGTGFDGLWDNIVRDTYNQSWQ